jgi:hypothetical protein
MYHTPYGCTYIIYPNLNQSVCAWNAKATRIVVDALYEN